MKEEEEGSPDFRPYYIAKHQESGRRLYIHVIAESQRQFSQYIFISIDIGINNSASIIPSIFVMNLKPAFECWIFTPSIPFVCIQHRREEDETEPGIHTGFEWEIEEEFSVLDSVRCNCTTYKQFDEEAIIVVTGKCLTKIFKTN
mmetsp:Transcript_13266/g.32401  ORF Transcript_13266/g.32401 Transcript_13266/m.32401 type:complete len:145 (-) Transcript_13266:1453-1887(-)